ncbi:MAG TPA: GDP-mannose 4,6-dehydratase [Gemmatimonadaceae bacterium]
MPTALITGVSGQDGTYLSELLVSKGYRVVGLTRDVAAARSGRFAGSMEGVELLESHLASVPDTIELLNGVRPDEVYHLAGPSRVSASWDDPAGTVAGIVTTTAVLLDGLRGAASRARLFTAGSCEIFASQDHGQDESAPRRPDSPYGTAKLRAHDLVEAGRDRDGLFAVTGILFNHDSPRRDESFVSRKITRGAARIARGEGRDLRLGNLRVRRDWGFAGDYVRAMWMMLQQDAPEDLVIGTGTAHSVADFCEVAFAAVGLGWADHVVSDPVLFRPADAPLRLADPGRARRRLGWSPEVDFHGLVSMMVAHEMGAGSGD